MTSSASPLNPLMESGTGFSRPGVYSLPISMVSCERAVKLAQALTIPVIASGGLNNLDDVRRLIAVEDEGIMGVITGRAIYEGTLDFAKARALAENAAA